MKIALVVPALALLFTGISSQARADIFSDLAPACSFAILAGSGITNSGNTAVSGDVGSYPTATEGGFGTLTLTGTNQLGDSITQAAKGALTTAFNNAMGLPATVLASDLLGGKTLGAGVYVSSAGDFDLTGALTLDAAGNTSSVFIFQTPANTLTVAGSVTLMNGAQAGNVFWIVGSSATINSGTPFIGTIIASASVTLNGGAAADGGLYAMNAGVSIASGGSIGDTLMCAVGTATPSSTATDALSTTPSPSATPSSTSTPDESTTPSGTVSPSASGTPNADTTPSVTSSGTPSATPTLSLSPSPSASPTSTASPTPGPLQPLNLGAACDFAILAGSAFTSTGATVVNGDVGSVAGETLNSGCVINGTNQYDNGFTSLAMNALNSAINAGLGLTPNGSLATELGGTTVFAGVWVSPGSGFDVTGTLTFDAQSDPAAVFIMQMPAAALTTNATTAVIHLVNGAQAKNVFWLVGTSATLDNGTPFIGTILAQGSINLDGNPVMQGSSLALAAVTIASGGTFTNTTCPAPVPTGSPSATATATSSPGESNTPSSTATGTATATAVETGTPSASATSTPSGTPNVSGTPSTTASSTFTVSPNETGTPSATVSGTVTSTPSSTPTATPGATPAGPLPVQLGTADGFSVLAATGVSNTNASSTTGYVGSYPTASETGFGTLAQSCTDEGNGLASQTAQSDASAAFTDAMGRAYDDTIGTTDMGGTTLPTGVYFSASTMQVTGALTLDGGGNANAVFIFQAGSGLIINNNSSIVLINGAQAKNVFWAVGSSASIGTNVAFAGTVLAYTSITVGTGSTVNGRLLALNGDITLIGNTITTPAKVACSDLTATPGTGSATPSATPSATSSATPSATSSATPNGSATPSPTASASGTPTGTSTPANGSPTYSATPSPTATATPGTSSTVTVSGSPTATPGGTISATSSATVSATVSRSPTLTPAASGTASSTASPTATRTPATSLTATPSGIPTALGTASPTATHTPALSATASPTAGTPPPTAGPAQSAVPGAPHSYIYPSPSRGSVGTVVYDLRTDGMVWIRIYNQVGNLADTITDAKSAGWNSSQVSVGKFAPGVYYYVLTVHYSDGGTQVDEARGFVVIH